MVCNVNNWGKKEKKRKELINRRQVAASLDIQDENN